MSLERLAGSLLAIASFSLVCAAGAHAQRSEPRSEVTSFTMGSATFELYAKVACGEGRADAVDYALRRALGGADLLPDRAAEMRRGIQESHAALVAKGGCTSYPAQDLASIRANKDDRLRELMARGGEMELDLPQPLGGTLKGRASYATVAVEGVPFSVLCLETHPGTTPSGSLVFLSPSENMLKEGRHDLGQLRGVARLKTPVAGDNADVQYGMLGISEPEGSLVRGSYTGFLRSGQLFSASFTAVQAEDPCGVKAELAQLRR
jgi:hypothetical protein